MEKNQQSEVCAWPSVISSNKQLRAQICLCVCAYLYQMEKYTHTHTCFKVYIFEANVFVYSLQILLYIMAFTAFYYMRSVH